MAESLAKVFLTLFGRRRYIREWIAGFELAAREAQDELVNDASPVGAPFPLGLCRCGVCGAVLVRMTLACTKDDVCPFVLRTHK